MPSEKTVVSTLFYELLDISSDASPEAIKKAYRKKALQLHPDKCGNSKEAQEKFTRMKYAYDVLSDPKKRKIYDRAGEDGVKLMENIGNLSHEEMAKSLFGSLHSVGKKGKLVLIVIITFIFGYFSMIPILWCLRVNKTISWSWVIVFIPMWILDCIYYCCLGCVYLVQEDEDPDNEKKKLPRSGLFKLYKFAKALLLLGFQILIAMRLNGDIRWSIKLVVLPYIAYDVLSYAEKIVLTNMALNMLTRDSQGAGASTTESIQAQKSRLLLDTGKILWYKSLQISQTVLIAYKIDGQLDTSWWIVLIPVWLYIASHIMRILFKYKAAQARNKKPKSVNVPTHDAYTRESEPEEPEASKSPAFDAILSLIALLIIVSPFFILSARLQNASFSAIYIILPWLIIIGIILLCSYCFIACLGLHVETEEANEEIQSPDEDEVQAHYLNVPIADPQ